MYGNPILKHVKNNIMKCVICKTGTTKKGKTIVAITKYNSVIVIKDVPADICQNCGEYYLSAQITKIVLNTVREALKKGTEIEVIKMQKIA